MTKQKLPQHRLQQLKKTEFVNERFGILLSRVEIEFFNVRHFHEAALLFTLADGNQKQPRIVIRVVCHALFSVSRRIVRVAPRSLCCSRSSRDFAQSADEAFMQSALRQECRQTLFIMSFAISFTCTCLLMLHACAFVSFHLLCLGVAYVYDMRTLAVAVAASLAERF